jgi:hypothetical protein
MLTAGSEPTCSPCVALPHPPQPTLLQFLESYKTVTLASMAAAFGVSPAFMDGELSDFIVAGRLPAKIDRVAGVVETNRCGCNACPLAVFIGAMPALWQFSLVCAYSSSRLTGSCDAPRVFCSCLPSNIPTSCCRPDAKNSLYQQTIKNGDHLLNRLQKLSKVIEA